MEKITKNKKILAIVGILVLIVCIISLFSGSDEIYGTWEVAERSLNENFNDYPEDDFVIYENGTFTADGISGQYSINGDTVTFNLSIFGSYTYEYDISGNTLMLKNIDDDDEPKIYYDRITK